MVTSQAHHHLRRSLHHRHSHLEWIRKVTLKTSWRLLDCRQRGLVIPKSQGLIRTARMKTRTSQARRRFLRSPLRLHYCLRLDWSRKDCLLQRLAHHYLHQTLHHCYLSRKSHHHRNYCQTLLRCCLRLDWSRKVNLNSTQTLQDWSRTGNLKTSLYQTLQGWSRMGNLPMASLN